MSTTKIRNLKEADPEKFSPLQIESTFFLISDQNCVYFNSFFRVEQELDFTVIFTKILINISAADSFKFYFIIYVDTENCPAAYRC